MCGRRGLGGLKGEGMLDPISHHRDLSIKLMLKVMLKIVLFERNVLNTQ